MQSSSKVSTIKTANKIKDKYLKIRKNNNQTITDQRKKDKLLNAINAIENVKNSSDKKRKNIAAQKIVNKYKNLKKPKCTYLVDEKDIERIDYKSIDEEDLYASESIVNATNKIFDYNKFKKDDAFAGQSIVNAANKILNKDIAGQSTLNQANKVLDFEQFKREQVRKIQEYNDELLNEPAEMINYVDDLNMDDVKDNKDLLIATKRIKE